MARRRRLSGRPRYTRLDWFVNEDMWDSVPFDLPGGSSVLLWNIGPTEDEKFWTVKRIMGMTRWISTDQGTLNVYWWIVKGIIDSGNVFVTQMESPVNHNQAEDSFLTWRTFRLPPNDTTPTPVDVPYYTHCDSKVQRRLQWPEQIGLLVQHSGASEDLSVVNFFRVLVARP